MTPQTDAPSNRRGRDGEAARPRLGEGPAPSGRRRTRQRAAVTAALADIDEFVSAQELHTRLAGSGERVGLATVYRALQALVDDGEVDVVRTADGESAYRRCSTRHHHHLRCRDCGSTVEIETSATEQWVAQVAREHGFTGVDHVIELIGLCAQCSAAAHEPDRPDGQS